MYASFCFLFMGLLVYTPCMLRVAFLLPSFNIIFLCLSIKKKKKTSTGPSLEKREKSLGSLLCCACFRSYGGREIGELLIIGKTWTK